MAEQYPITLLTSQRNFFIYQDGTNLRFSSDHGQTYNKTMSITGMDTIKFIHVFENENVLLCTQNRAFYTEDFVTYSESSLYDDNNNLITLTGYDHFFTAAHDNNPQIVDGEEILAWGNYSNLAGVQYAQMKIWYTIDFGKTIKMAYKFRDTNSIGSNPNLYIRHVHGVHFNHEDGSFWALTGDEPSGAENRHVMKGFYNKQNDSWIWEVIGSGYEFKWANAFFYDGYVYWSHDVSNGGVGRAPYNQAGDISTHEKLMTTPNDTQNVQVSYSGEMVVIQSWWGGSNPTSNFWYSPDRVNFYQISSTFPPEYAHQYNFYDSPRVTSQNRISFGVNDRHENDMHLWSLKPRVFVDEIVRNSGFPNAFSPHLVAPPEVTGLSSQSNGSSVSLTWTNPNHPDFSHVRILRNGVEIESKFRGTSYVDTGAVQGQTYTYLVKTADFIFNESAGQSINADGTSPEPDPDQFGDTLILSKGLKANLPLLDEGEMAFCTDTRELFIGSNEGNFLLLPQPSPIGVLTEITDLTASLFNGASVRLEWTDVSAATDYDIRVNGTKVANVSGSPYITDVLPAGVQHTFTVIAKSADNQSTGVSIDMTPQARTTTSYPISLITTQEDVFVDYNIPASTLRLSTDHGVSYPKSMSSVGIGVIKLIHAFTDGSIMICTANKAYYTDDFITYKESTLLDDNGNAITLSGVDKFATTGFDLRTQVVDGIEMLVWGNYSNESGVAWTNNIVVWYTVDKGRTLKMAYRYNDGGAEARHVHAVVQNPHDDSFWVGCGDDIPEADHIRRGVYNSQNDTWSWTTLGNGREFKWGTMTFIGDYIYWAWDVPSGGICRSLASEISDVSKHEKIFTTSNDAINISASERGELIVAQSTYGGTDRTDKFWYSPDRINFYMIDAPFIDGTSNRGGTWDTMRRTSQGKLSSAVYRSDPNWQLQPRVFLDDLVKSSGFPNAFKPIGTENILVGEVINLNTSSTGNSITMSWIKPANSYLSHIRVLRDGVLRANHLSGVNYTDTGLSSNTTYTYTIQTIDIAGNVSEGQVRTIKTL